MAKLPATFPILHPSPARILIEDLNTCLSRNTPALSSRSHHPLTQLCDRWRTERCLVVLDGLESAFVPGTWAGTWQSNRAEIAQLIDHKQGIARSASRP